MDLPREPAEGERPTGPHPWSLVTILRRVYLVGGTAFVALWLVQNRSELAAAWRGARPAGVVIAVVLAVVAVLPVLGCWRASVASLGSRLSLRDASAIFLPAQLARFLPGSVWSFAAQAERGVDRGIPVRHTFPGSLLSLAASLIAAMLVGVVCAPSLVGNTGVGILTLVVAVLAVVAVAVLVWRPQVVTSVLSRVRPLDQDLVVRRSRVLVAIAWAGTAWVVYGLHALALAVALGAPLNGSVLTCIGGFAIAWVAGFVAVFAPAGLGVREAALVVTLQGVLTSDEAVVLALLSRAILTMVDVGVAAVGLRLGRVQPGRPASGLSREDGLESGRDG